MSTPKDEEMKVRVPRSIKVLFQRLADDRLTSASALAREAFLEYLARHNISGDQIREVGEKYIIRRSK